MASISYVANKLSAAGLTVLLDGEFLLVSDPELGFERSHDGVKGISRFCSETLDEYAEACQELFQESPEEAADELPQEEPEVFNYVNAVLKMLGRNAQPAADPPPAPPIKAHIPDSEQLALAREINGALCPASAKEIAQALENDLQDRGGIPNPVEYITEMKQETAMAEAKIATIVKTEFRVSGVGYHTGKFSRSFNEPDAAKEFARRCSLAAQNASYAATIKIVPLTTRTPV